MAAHGGDLHNLPMGEPVNLSEDTKGFHDGMGRKPYFMAAPFHFVDETRYGDGKSEVGFL